MRTPAAMAAKGAHAVLLTVLYLFLLAPLLVVVLVSFSSNDDLSFPIRGYTLDWYSRLLDNAVFLRGAQISLVVGASAALLAVTVGVTASLAIARGQFRGKGAIEAFFLSPIIVPAIVLGLGLLIFLSPLGLIGTYAGLIAAHLGIAVPYVMRTTLGSLRSTDASSEEAARVLGANPWRVFRTVTLPTVMPGVVAGAVMAFLISFDEAVISLFIVGGGAPTLPVAMLDYVQYQADPQLASVSVLLILVSLSAVLVVEKTVGLGKAVA